MAIDSISGAASVIAPSSLSRLSPPPETRAWAERVVDEVIERNRPPRWTDRFRRVKPDPPKQGSVDV